MFQPRWIKADHCIYWVTTWSFRYDIQTPTVILHQFFSHSFSMVTRQNSANDLSNIYLESQAAGVKSPCKWADSKVEYESGYNVDPDVVSVGAAAHAGASVWSAPVGINSALGISPVSKKNAAQPLLRPREKSLSQSCSLAPSTGQPTATTTKTEDRFIPLEGANFARKPPPLMHVVALRGAAGAVVLCAVPWAGFCAARTFQPFSRALLA